MVTMEDYCPDTYIELPKTGCANFTALFIYYDELRKSFTVYGDSDIRKAYSRPNVTEEIIREHYSEILEYLRICMNDTEWYGPYYKQLYDQILPYLCEW